MMKGWRLSIFLQWFLEAADATGNNLVTLMDNNNKLYMGLPDSELSNPNPNTRRRAVDGETLLGVQEKVNWNISASASGHSL